MSDVDIPSFGTLLKDLPLVAILRNVRPMQVLEISDVLIALGFRFIEVPLNSPDPWLSIKQLQRSFSKNSIIGAGTITTIAQLDMLADLGAPLAVMPHCDPLLIRHAIARRLIAIPGVATPTEAFSALGAGAHALKVFPMEALAANTLKAWRSVLPPKTILLPVGGIDASNMMHYLKHGANGFGLGSALFKAGDDSATVHMNASKLISAWHMANESL